MVIHDILKEINYYGDSALICDAIDRPRVTPGNSPNDKLQYDYWDHMDFIIDLAASKGIYMGLVPIWGSNIKSGNVSSEQARKYIDWLAERYKNRKNVIWINGGDIKGSDSTATWNLIGSEIKRIAPSQLVTFHPFGRTQSSTWFHNENWLDFNMFQSGHRRYDQDTARVAYGEDNWRYINDDYWKTPVKPTLDGEPSYENIPQGLHDVKQPLWKDRDVRRYAYWSVFAGGAGFTYGHNSIMQFYRSGDKSGAYGAILPWQEAMDAPGAGQMIYLKNLMLSRSYSDRVPFQEIIEGNQGDKYNHLVATKGTGYAFVYTYNGRNFALNLDLLGSKNIKAAWYNPRDGKFTDIGTLSGNGIKEFDPPGEKEDGNDWVLVIDKI